MNIPNTLSAVRILLIPFFCYKFLTAADTNDYLIAAAILAFSGISDMLDGYIARKFNMITQLGKVLDPVADKLTLFAVCISFYIKNPHLWFLLAFLMLKDIVIMIGSVFLMNRKIKLDGARWFGKVYTVLFYVIMLAMVIDSEMTVKMQFILLGFMAVLTVACFAMYVPVFFSLKNGD